MTLSVDVFMIGEDGRIDVLPVPDGCSDLAGFERWRTTVWGSEAVRALGATYFPVLADSDLDVAPDQVADFRAECALIRDNIELIAAGDDPLHSHAAHTEGIAYRLKNIEDAAVRAQELGGGVRIW
ncbi:hypothetical protein [Yinghuangia soli]|uniref:Uncharacterized protein n=1 Tax=Yinghuangia soli TaxID=2908204 RepID=A0AA41PWP3_9ACTN|nr:hypothetical protein [Yinghuangia soli]MCF2526957.1 hypothetical protein [Yinghuangia soli]